MDGALCNFEMSVRELITVYGVNHCLLIMLISVYDPQSAAGDLTIFCISFGLSLLFCLHWFCVLQEDVQTTAVVIHKLDNTAECSPPCALATLSPQYALPCPQLAATCYNPLQPSLQISLRSISLLQYHFVSSFEVSVPKLRVYFCSSSSVTCPVHLISSHFITPISS